MTVAQLKSALKPLRSYSDEDVAGKMTLAEAYFDVARWGDHYLEGLANWVWGTLVLDELDDGEVDDGAQVSGSVGDTSWSLDPELAHRQADDQLTRTRGGQRYRQLADLVGMGGVAL